MNLTKIPGYAGSGAGGFMFSEYPNFGFGGRDSEWQPPWATKPTAANGTGMYGNPFGTAMSGTKSGTLQPYINRMTQNASNALYGGLLGYQPQSLIAGDAGGTPQNSTVPQFNMPSALGQGLNFTGFGNRSWMNQGGQ